MVLLQIPMIDAQTESCTWSSLVYGGVICFLHRLGKNSAGHVTALQERGVDPS